MNKMSSVIVLDSDSSDSDETPKAKRPIIISSANSACQVTAKLIPLTATGSTLSTSTTASPTTTSILSATRKTANILTKINTSVKNSPTIPNATVKSINIPSGITVTRHGVSSDINANMPQIMQKPLATNPANGNKLTTIQIGASSVVAKSSADATRGTSGITVEMFKNTIKNQLLISSTAQATAAATASITTQSKSAVPQQFHSNKPQTPPATASSTTQIKTSVPQQFHYISNKPQTPPATASITTQARTSMPQQFHSISNKLQTPPATLSTPLKLVQAQTRKRNTPTPTGTTPITRSLNQQLATITPISQMPVLSPISTTTFVSNNTNILKRKLLSTPPSIPTSVVNYSTNAKGTMAPATTANVRLGKPATPPAVTNIRIGKPATPPATTVHFKPANLPNVPISGLQITPLTAGTNLKIASVKATKPKLTAPSKLTSSSINSHMGTIPAGTNMLPVISAVHSLQTTPTPPLRLLASPPPTASTSRSPPAASNTGSGTNLKITAVGSISKLSPTIVTTTNSSSSSDGNSKTFILTAAQAKILKDSTTKMLVGSAPLTTARLSTTAVTQNSPTTVLPATNNSSSVGNTGTASAGVTHIKRIQPKTILKKSDEAWQQRMEKIPGLSNSSQKISAIDANTPPANKEFNIKSFSTFPVSRDESASSTTTCKTSVSNQVPSPTPIKANSSTNSVSFEDKPTETAENMVQAKKTVPCGKLSPINDTSKTSINGAKSKEELKSTPEVGNEQPAPLEPDYIELIAACRAAESTPDMERLIEIKLIKYYHSVQTSFVRSRGFRKTIRGAIDNIHAEPDMVYFHLKAVIDELRARRKAKDVSCNETDQQQASIELTSGKSEASTPATDTADDQKSSITPNVCSITNASGSVQNVPSIAVNKRTDEQIRKLNRALYILKKKIESLEQAEVDLNDDDSSYLQVERFKKRACQIYEKICDLTGESKSAHRLVRQSIQFKDTDYPQFNKTLQAYINQTREFPDYHDVLRMLEHCNTKYSLGLASFEMKRIAHDAFTKVGKLLQTRRKTDLYETVTHFTANAKDPAAEDLELAAKLSENQKNQKKISEIIEKYAREQDLTAEEQREARLKEKQQKLAEANNSDDILECGLTADPTTSNAALATETTLKIEKSLTVEDNDNNDVGEGDDDDDDGDDDDDEDDEDDEEEDDDADLDDVQIVENLANGDISDAESAVEEIGILLTPGTPKSLRSLPASAQDNISFISASPQVTTEATPPIMSNKSPAIIIGDDPLLTATPITPSSSPLPSPLSLSLPPPSKKSKLSLDAFLDDNYDEQILQENKSNSIPSAEAAVGGTTTATIKRNNTMQNVIVLGDSPEKPRKPTTIVDLDNWSPEKDILTLEELLAQDISPQSTAKKTKSINNKKNNKRKKTGNNNNNISTAAAAITTATKKVPNGRVKQQQTQQCPRTMAMSNACDVTQKESASILKLSSVSTLQHILDNPKTTEITMTTAKNTAIPKLTKLQTEIIISDEES